MLRQKEGLIEYPELSEIEQLDDGVIRSLGENLNLDKQEARTLAISIALAKRAYYSACMEFDIAPNVDSRPFDTTMWDIALANARSNKWSSMSVLLKQDAQPLLIDDVGKGEDLALGLALIKLAHLIG